MKTLSLYQYITKFLKIQTKDGQLINLKPNAPQKRLYDVFKEHYNKNEPCKIIILKARQMGFSTMTEAIISAVCMTNSYVNALIVAHDNDATNNIYTMAKRYYDNLPVDVKPMLKYNNSKMLDFENPSTDVNERSQNQGLHSTIRIATAGHGAIGRSATFQYMHLSELAFWPDTDAQSVQDQMTGLLQTLPQKGRSLLVIESTANGYNYFKTLWDQAVNGDSDFVPLFFPWFEMPEYVKPYNGEPLNADELVEQKKYGLSNEQLMWRRYAISTLCGGSLEQFQQEYPSCPEEAFILTGTPFFNTKSVTRRASEVEEAPVRGQFTEQGSWYDDQYGYIEKWEEPLADHVYGIGCDTAGEGSDFFVAYVIDKTADGKQVAKYRARSDERVFVNQIYWLGMHYNLAMLAIETNFSTYPVRCLQDMGYPNMYVREQADTYTNHIQKKFGFRTTSITRPLILDTLKEVVNETPEKINDPTFFNECMSFQKNEKGKPQATTGSHDDCVMAMAIAYGTLAQAHNIFGSSEGEDDLPEDYEEVQSFLNYGG